MDSKNYVDEIKDYVKDPSVKAIVLRVDSPGGAVAPLTGDIRRGLRRQL